ncbi:MAG: polysaccharide deacetylase family protein [Bdellovibrionaceae bacterium]|nr:polysaccharide deacetylase family protein [Pseudobdellovibrionaceae bacterium]
MRILQLLSQIQPTGAEAYAIVVANWLSDQGHEVYFASDKLHSQTRQPFFPLAVHSNSLLTRIQSTLKLRQLLKSKSIQVIHCHSRAAARLAYWATLGSNIAVTSTLHGRQPISLSKKLLNIYGDPVLCICENVVALMTEKLRMNPRILKLVRNPVDCHPLTFREAPPEKLKIAWIGRFTGPKGERAKQLFLEVAPKLLSEFSDLQIDFIGGDAAVLGVQTESPRLKVQNHLNNLDKELSNYQLVLASGRVAMSALLCGVPTYAIGEYKSEGLVTRESFPSALASNFGDIGPDGEPTSAIDFKKIGEDLRQFLLARDSLSAKSERQALRQLVLQNFDHEVICRKIYNSYKSAYFKKNYRKSIPVLMYHKIPDTELNSRHRIFVTKDNFKKHLDFFKNKGFVTLQFRDLEDFRSGKKDFSLFPKKPLILTFDDGYVDNLKNVAPLLVQYQMKAVIYLLADHSITHNFWDDDGKEPTHSLMTLTQKKELLTSKVFEVGSHGLRHQKITEMTESDALTELRESKAKLEKDLSTTVSSFAYTYGVTSKRASELAEQAGYEFAVNTDSGGLLLEENPYAIFRINIFPEDGPQQLWKKTARWYRRYFYLKRGR